MVKMGKMTGSFLGTVVLVFSVWFLAEIIFFLNFMRYEIEGKGGEI